MMLGTYHFTNHALFKMAFYGLSEGRVRRVIKSPTRVEEGIAPDTIAMMQPSSIKTKQGTRMWSQEIWVMMSKRENAKRGITNNFKTIGEHTKNEKINTRKSMNNNSRIVIISAWRYPGMSKSRVGLPQAVLDEIHEALRALS